MGTWATPNTPAKARKLAKLLARPLPASRATDVLYDLVGDDRLFDTIGANIRDGFGQSDVRSSVARKIKEWDEYYHATPGLWRNKITPATWAVLRRTYKKILR